MLTLLKMRGCPIRYRIRAAPSEGYKSRALVGIDTERMTDAERERMLIGVVVAVDPSRRQVEIPYR
jgi:hypothetical protein